MDLLIGNLEDIGLAVALGVAYRFRGGGFIATGRDTLVRAVWSIVFAGAAWAIDPGHHLLMLALFVPMYLAIDVVPHAFAQYLGHGPRPSCLEPVVKRWPQAWQKPITQAQWNSWPLGERIAYDAIGMGCAGLLRALIVFAPARLCGFTTVGAVEGALLYALLAPDAYALGWITPFTFGKSLPKRGPEWGELYTGFAWCMALVVAAHPIQP